MCRKPRQDVLFATQALHVPADSQEAFGRNYLNPGLPGNFVYL